jgi:hypothetical protein
VQRSEEVVVVVALAVALLFIVITIMITIIITTAIIKFFFLTSLINPLFTLMFVILQGHIECVSLCGGLSSG